MIIKISMRIIDALIKTKLFKVRNYDDFEDNVIFLTFFIISNIFFFGLAYIFECIPQMIIVLIVLNVLRLYSGGYHSTTLDKCLCISIPLILSTAIISKYIMCQVNILLFISMVFGIYIIKKVPIISKENMNGKTKEWFVSKYINTLILFYFISFLCVNMNNYIGNLISSAISMSILCVALMMRYNKKSKL